MSATAAVTELRESQRGTQRPRWLRSGPLEMLFDNGDLRYLRLGGREVIRRIYGAVRDRNWVTIPSNLTRVRYEIKRDRFSITYTSRHRRDEIDFIWKAEISGSADGTVRFQFLGKARTTFLRNRIGLCVLHPIRECAGARCEAHYVDGSVKQLRFPKWIATDQPVRGFHDLAGLSHEIVPGLFAELRFEGEVFEMEDQRNWIDASFKTYGTPLRLPRPVEIKTGTCIRHMVELKIMKRKGSAKRLVNRPPARLSFVKGEKDVVQILPCSERRRLPAIGFGSSSQNGRMDERSLRRLQALKPAHIRVEVRTDDPRTLVSLPEQCSLATALGARVELIVHLSDSAESESNKGFLNALALRLHRTATQLARVLVFGLGARHASSAEGLALAREQLGGLRAPLGAGSNADLYELNRATGVTEADCISWGMNPQVHALDLLSLAETPEAAAQQVASVRHRFPGRPLIVSPVTLKPRFNAVATDPAGTVPPGELPPEVDVRQVSLFSAAWTLAIIKALSESGTDSVTFYETTGWRGLLETSGGSPLPNKFPSIAGAVFPLYHIFADVAEFAGGMVRRTKSSAPLDVSSLLLEHGEHRRLLVANLAGQPCRTTLRHLGRKMRFRIVNAINQQLAMTEPEAFRASSQLIATNEIELGPHAMAVFDFPTC